MIDVLVLNYNDSRRCIEYINSIRNYQSIDHVLVVDNNSSDNSFELLKQFENKKIIVIKTEKNGGYGYGNNYGILYLKKFFNSKYIAITNPDVIYKEDVLHECVRFLLNNDKYSICAPSMMSPEGKACFCAWNIRKWYEYVFQNLLILGRFFAKNNLTDSHDSFYECDCVAGSMLVVDSDNLKKIGLYDEKIFLYCEETVLGLKNGKHRSAVLKNTFFIHEHSVSINKTLKSDFIKTKIQWKSRMYVLKEYYHLNRIKYAVAYIVKNISLLEIVIFSFVKKRFKRNKKR